MIAVFFPISGGEWQGAQVELPKAVTRAVRHLTLASDNTRRDLETVARKLLPAAGLAPDVCTVAQFCGERGLHLAMADMQRMGKAAAKFSRQQGLAIGRAVDAAFGEVNAYRKEALEAVAQLQK